MDKEKILAVMNEKSCGFNKHNGITVADFSEAGCTVEGKLTPEAKNPLGMAHGGFIYSLCDAAAGIAAFLAGRPGVTLSSDMHFLHPSGGEALRCEGRVIKKGAHVVVVETKVFDDSGTVTATGLFEMFVTAQEGKKA